MLKKYGIITIGDIAKSNPAFLRLRSVRTALCCGAAPTALKIRPSVIWAYRPPVKSVGRGVTCVDDLRDNDEVWRVLLSLSHAVSKHR